MNNYFNMSCNENLFEIRLDSIRGLVSKATLKHLEENNIIMVGDLLEKSCNVDFINHLSNSKLMVDKETLDVIKYLKCKYLNVDPQIDFSKEYFFLFQFGFTRRTHNALALMRVRNDNIFELLDPNNKKRYLNNYRLIGETVYDEVVCKLSIIYNYYKQKYQQDLMMAEANSVKYLLPEFKYNCDEIMNLLLSGKLSLESSQELLDRIDSLRMMLYEYNNAHFVEKKKKL